jgi:hypothetical protein
MRNQINISSFFLLLLLWPVSALRAQDMIYLSKGDSMSVKIPGDPKKETDLHKKAYGDLDDYGFLRIVVIYKNDSLRIHSPEEIKGFRRDTIGKYIGSGYFESRVLDTKVIGYGRRGSERPVFLQRVVSAHQYTIWYYREGTADASPDYYYLLEEKDRPGYRVFTIWKEWVAWAEKTEPFSEILTTVPPPKRKKGFSIRGFSYLQNVFRYYRDHYNADGTKIVKQ